MDPGPELAYWLQEGEAGRVPADHPAGADTQASARAVTVWLTDEETNALLQKVPAAYRTRVDDVLLTALVRTLAGPDGSLRVDIEGHGREEIFDEDDLSRTVGWLTSLFPVRLAVEPSSDPGRALCAVKEQLRGVPRGIGYGLLFHLRGDEAVTAQLRRVPQAAVSFNYLGQLDQTFPAASLFALAGESS